MPCLDVTVVVAIRNHFDQGISVCLLTGLSGSGKTQAAFDYLQQDGQQYENHLWIFGSDCKSNTSLSSVQRAKGGVAVNVAGIFNSDRTLSRQNWTDATKTSRMCAKRSLKGLVLDISTC